MTKLPYHQYSAWFTGKPTKLALYSSADYLPHANTITSFAQHLGIDHPSICLKPELDHLQGDWLGQDNMAIHSQLTSYHPRYHDPAKPSEALLQAMSGITALHRRGVGQWTPLGVPYVQTLASSMYVTVSMAALLGRYRGLPQAKVSVHQADVALFAMSLYMAMQAAQYPSNQPFANEKVVEVSSLPFISRDQVCFELEALHPDGWISFWQQLGITVSDAAQAWPEFMGRYVNAYVFLPQHFSQVIASSPFSQLMQCADIAGVQLCPLSQFSSQLDILAEFKSGWSGERIVSATKPDTEPNQLIYQPLKGLTIIECCRLIQGPLASFILQQLGARVIKIEPPGGDLFRAMPPFVDGISAHFNAINQGKNCIEIDIKTIEGREQILQLVAEADVFLHNWAPGKAQQYQLTAQDLHKIKPDLIYASGSGFGSEIASPIGTDYIVQAHSGLASTILRKNHQSGGGLLTLTDILGGFAFVEGIVAALYAREQDGYGRVIDSSMCGAAACLLRAHAQLSDVPHCVNVVALQDGYLMIDAGEITAADIEIIKQLTLNEAKHYVSVKGGRAEAVSLTLDDIIRHPRLQHNFHRFPPAIQFNMPWEFIF